MKVLKNKIDFLTSRINKMNILHRDSGKLERVQKKIHFNHHLHYCPLLTRSDLNAVVQHNYPYPILKFQPDQMHN